MSIPMGAPLSSCSIPIRRSAFPQGSCVPVWLSMGSMLLKAGREPFILECFLACHTEAPTWWVLNKHSLDEVGLAEDKWTYHSHSRFQVLKAFFCHYYKQTKRIIQINSQV
jgi:hypothetical protein